MTAAVPRLRAGTLLDPGTDRPARHVDLVVDGGAIGAVVPSTGDAPAVGGPDALVLPALADAHDHGRGVGTIAFGAADQALETWLPALALQPWVDAGVLAGLSLCRLARSGVASVVHCHNTQRDAELVDECASVARTARAVGVRVGLAVPLADRHRIGYGADDDVLAEVAPAWRAAVGDRWRGTPMPVAEQLARVDEVAAVAAAEGGGLVHTQYGPIGPQWCSPELLAAVADASARTGRRVHMHLCETRYQREWADAALPGGLLPWLDGLGLLSDRLTVAHAVWLDDDDLALLAERRVVVSVNATSNLRLRSGRARLHRMRELGVRVASGLDGMSVDDDEDALRELQMTHLLNAGTGLETDVTALDVLQASATTGPVAVAGDGPWGRPVAGAPADLVVLDGAALRAGVMPGVHETTDEVAALVLARARARHVTDLVVAGRHVVGGGRVLGFDEAGATAELTAALAAAAPEVAALQPLVRALQDGLTAFYESGGHRRAGVPAEGVVA